MYMDYSKLWKLLIDKRMNKTDLMMLTGISSRVLAKLSKNETVTTDTLARICAALDCDVCDIMEYASGNPLSLYAAYRKLGECVEESDTCRVIRFTHDGQRYTVYASLSAANKGTHIFCEEDGTVSWVQNHLSGGLSGVPQKSTLIKPKPTAEEITIVLIIGKPGVIVGLDENGFISARGTRKADTDVYVMSEAAFKLFSPPPAKR